MGAIGGRPELRQPYLRHGTTRMPDTYVIDDVGVVRQVFVNSRNSGSRSAIHCVESMVGG